MDETEPLIQPRSPLLVFAERSDDLPESAEDWHGKERVSLGPFLSQKLSRGARDGMFTGDRSYLPFHRRKRTTYPNYVLGWTILFVGISVVALLACVVVACILLNTIQHSTGPYPTPLSRLSEDSARNPAYLIKAKNGAVATENIVCSNIGVDVLKEGGNAVDAAVASTFCIGVVNLFS